MYKTPKLLLIDGNNLCFRQFYSKSNLTYKGKSVNVLYGFFKSLISFHKKWPEHFMIVAWEGGYDRRIRESEEGVKQGIIPESYKQNRREQEPDPEIEKLFEQKDELYSLLTKTKVMQVRIKGYEADDVINSYAEWTNRHNGEAIIVSSDKDFYQCLSENVKVYIPKSDEVLTKEYLEKECDFSIEHWLDKMAIEGEVGPSKDNIFGVDGWGPSTSSKYVTKYGDIDSISDALENQSKLSKKEQKFLEQKERVKLAKSLKTMDIIPDLPMPRKNKKPSEEEIVNMFINWGFGSLKKDAWRLV